jgi:hypothetical protein
MSVSALFTGGSIDDPTDVTVTTPLIDQAIQATVVDADALTAIVSNADNITANLACED